MGFGFAESGQDDDTVKGVKVAQKYHVEWACRRPASIKTQK